MSEDEDLPRLLSGRYRLEGTLGRGGMGIVYRGTDLMMKRSIAVKLIRAVDGNELDDEIAGRFLREAKNTARLQHEHIIEVFDLGRSDEGMYFVMELLEGESLSARLRRDGSFDPAETVHIGRQIAEALQVAHSAGVIHRDLKPANVMLLSRAGDDSFVKVLDFGVAKSTHNDGETQLTHTGMLVGTVDYMAPEQIMGKPVDGRTDIYALGIVLYKMLSGRSPFRDAGVPALIHAHMNTMPKPLIEVVPGIPNDLDRVVLRCLAKSPDRRYESMAELARALVAALAPDGADLPDLNADAYGSDADLTAIAQGGVYKKPSLGPPEDLFKKPSAEDVTVHESSRKLPRGGDSSRRLPEVEDVAAASFEDATIKMDRSLDTRKPPSPIGALGALRTAPAIVPRMPAPLPAAGRPAPLPAAGRPAQPPPTSRPSHPSGPIAGPPSNAPFARMPAPSYDELGPKRDEPRTCGMCASANAPHARVCSSCGNLLVPDARAVPRGPGAVHPSVLAQRGPSLPPGPGPVYGPGPGVPFPLAPGPGFGKPAAPPSMWERFLAWTGLRSR